jgi:hypothetical protein
MDKRITRLSISKGTQMKSNVLDVMQMGPYLVFFNHDDIIKESDVKNYMEDRNRTLVFGPVETVWGDTTGDVHVTFRNKELQNILGDEMKIDSHENLIFKATPNGFQIGEKCHKNWMLIFAFTGMSIAHLNSIK